MTSSHRRFKKTCRPSWRRDFRTLRLDARGLISSIRSWARLYSLVTAVPRKNTARATAQLIGAIGSVTSDG
ncbi:hypothetical protein BST61_g11440 [Cercospora zeina]